MYPTTLITVVPEDGDPIPAEQAAIVALVIDQIEPDTDITAENLHRALAAESTNPPSLREVRTVLDILAMPHVGFTPGESSAAVLKRMRDMLEVAESPPSPLDHWNNEPY
ncbi:hypothetical protein ACIBEH_06030 [Nocardia salmonicida]|uniref:hypothetical protein n=1 Tax=Nocardia salmonicida TaxID=53431 RepID=UPI0037B1A4AF